MKVKIAVALLCISTCAIGADDNWPRWEGWELMGSSGVFHYASEHGPRQLLVSSNEPSAALRKNAGLPLSPDLELSWQWQVEAIPSTAAEDIEEHHHYFAVSVIFDNGKNLSYIWSAKLEREYGFRCPLKDWRKKETHVVVESGTAEFGRVLSYRRNIQADYIHFIGGALPKKVTKVWIVALVKGGEGPLRARLMRLSLGSDEHGRTGYL